MDTVSPWGSDCHKGVVIQTWPGLIVVGWGPVEEDTVSHWGEEGAQRKCGTPKSDT